MLHALFMFDLFLNYLWVHIFLSLDFKVQKNAVVAQLRDCLLASNIDMEYSCLQDFFYSFQLVDLICPFMGNEKKILTPEVPGSPDKDIPQFSRRGKGTFYGKLYLVLF